MWHVWVCGSTSCGTFCVHRWHCDVVSNTKFFNFLNSPTTCVRVYMHQHTATSTTHTFQLSIHHQIQHTHTIKKTRNEECNASILLFTYTCMKLDRTKQGTKMVYCAFFKAASSFFSAANSSLSIFPSWSLSTSSKETKSSLTRLVKNSFGPSRSAPTTLTAINA